MQRQGNAAKCEETELVGGNARVKSIRACRFATYYLSYVGFVFVHMKGLQQRTLLYIQHEDPHGLQHHKTFFYFSFYFGGNDEFSLQEYGPLRPH